VIRLAGGRLVLSDRQLEASLLFGAGRIVAIEPVGDAGPPAPAIDVSGLLVVPGFVDGHVHGVAGTDVLDGSDAVSVMASLLPRYGVTAFCPTTMACEPEGLDRALQSVRAARAAPRPGSALVLAAHLESNFISGEFRGAQPAACLRQVPFGFTYGHVVRDRPVRSYYDGDQILDVISARREDAGIVTLAPELEGALELIAGLVDLGIRVSLGHSGATFEQAMAAFDRGATRATHLFNCMPPVHHRAPGLAGAVLARRDVAAELICDGYHVHPALCRAVVAAKGLDGVMAITDGTALSGLPQGSTATLGLQRITAGARAAHLDDGTLAGSVATMDRAFRMLVREAGLDVVEAARLCATTPAERLGLGDMGVLAPGARADIVVLDAALEVVRTFVGGLEAYCRPSG